METKKKNGRKKEIAEESGFSWEILWKIFWEKAEEKIKEGAGEVNFFLKKKIAAIFLTFWGTGLLLVGVALLLEQVLSFWGISGGGWVLMGGGCLLLAGVVGNLKK